MSPVKTPPLNTFQVKTSPVRISTSHVNKLPVCVSDDQPPKLTSSHAFILAIISSYSPFKISSI
jgi:hypothetical protein